MPPIKRARLCLLESSHTKNYGAFLAKLSQVFTNRLFYLFIFLKGYLKTLSCPWEKAWHWNLMQPSRMTGHRNSLARPRQEDI